MLSEFLSPLIDYLSNLIVQFGYAGIFAVTFIENIIAPIPSEFVFPWAGFLASQGKLSLFLIAFSGALGSLAAALVLYYLGRSMSGDKSRKFVAKYGKYLFVKEEDLEKAEGWFKNYGVWTVLIFRLIPLGRTIISVPAGFIKMNIWEFSLLTFIGTFAWCFILAYLGFVLGENWEVILDFTSSYEKIVILGIAAMGITFLYWRRRTILKTIKNLFSNS